MVRLSCSGERCGPHGYGLRGVAHRGACRVGCAARAFAEALLWIRPRSTGRCFRKRIIHARGGGAIVIPAVSRFANPIAVQGEAVTAVASLGLLLNILVVRMLTRGNRDLNMRAALLHVLGDLLGSLAALVSGITVWATGWYAVDPALSLIIALIIAYSSLKLVREAFHGLMEGVPLHLSLEEIGKTMAGVEGNLRSRCTPGRSPQNASRCPHTS